MSAADRAEDLQEAIETMIVSVASSGMRFLEIEAWLKRRIRRKPDGPNKIQKIGGARRAKLSAKCSLR